MTSPEDLVRLIRSGPSPRELAAARERLWALCQAAVAALARRYTRHAPDLLDDYLSEAYLKFDQAVASFDPDRGVPFHGYLRACVERHFLDRARRKAPRLTPRPPERAGPGPDALELLGDREQAELIGAALAALLPRDPRRLAKLRAFRLRHFEGWPLERIRLELGAPSTDAVAQWVFRARQALRAELARRGYHAPAAPGRAGARRRPPRAPVTGGRRC